MKAFTVSSTSFGLFCELISCPVQDLDASVAREEETLLRVESQAETVKAYTSPAGAELITEETEELRLAWERLRNALPEIHAELKGSADARKKYHTLREDLVEGIQQLRALVREMSQKLENKDGERSEENVVAQWKTYTVSLNPRLLFRETTHTTSA